MRNNEQLSLRQCYECKELLTEDNFYTDKNDRPYHLCKKCMCKNINDFNPLTFIQLCANFNIPYIETEWRALVFHELRRSSQEKKIYRENGYGTIFGKYLSLMKLKGWQGYEFKDSAYLNLHGADSDYNDDYQYIQIESNKYNSLPIHLYLECIKPPKDWKEHYKKWLERIDI